LRLGPKLALAHFGEVHPRVLKAMGVEGPVFAFEAFIDAIPAAKPRATKTKPALQTFGLLPVRRDFAFVVDRALGADQLLKAVWGAEKKLIADVTLFDVYEGKGVAEGKKSLAVEVTLQPRDRTLTDEEIDRVAKAIIAAAEKAAGARLRA
jgi:phenylalanyl-tRNA synthetase beta chain